MARKLEGKTAKSKRETDKESLRERTGRPTEKAWKPSWRTSTGRLPAGMAYFKHAKDNELRGIDGWIRMRLRSILRKRRGCEGRGRDHQRWPNRYFTELGLFCLLEAKVSEIISLRYGANH